MTIRQKIFRMLLAILLTSVGAGILYYFPLSGATLGQLAGTYAPVKVNGTDEVSDVIEATEPMTLLFLGVDTGTGSRTDEWVGNSDSMLLVTVNPKTKQTTMMSLERDVLVNLSNADGEATGEQTKLNAAYQEGEVAQSIATIQDLMNIKIDRYVMINMQGMIKLVDAVNGIKVNNELGFTISIEEQEPEYTATIKPGEQTLDGDQALVYARMRYQDPQGDYGRQKRQREVIQKIIAKALSMDSISKYQQIFDAVSDNIQTNIKINSTTIQQLLGYQNALKNIKTYQLTGVDAMFEGTSYQIVTGEHLLEMQNVLQKSLGKSAYTDLKTSAVLYEDLYGTTAETPDYSESASSGSSAGTAETAEDGTAYGTETYGSAETYTSDYTYGY